MLKGRCSSGLPAVCLRQKSSRQTLLRPSPCLLILDISEGSAGEFGVCLDPTPSPSPSFCGEFSARPSSGVQASARATGCAGQVWSCHITSPRGSGIAHLASPTVSSASSPATWCSSLRLGRKREHPDLSAGGFKLPYFFAFY